MVDAAWINAGCLIIFINQRLQIPQRAIGFCPCQRGGQMIDDYGLGTSLGLSALTGVIDNEWVDVGRWSNDRLG